MKQIKIEGKSDIGLKRQENQDSFLILEDGNYSIAAVADGMGGHRGGKDASRIAVEALESEVKESFGKLSPPQIIESAFIKADEEIKRESISRYGQPEMATTCSLVFVVKPGLVSEADVVGEVYIGHVGDSRIYRIRESQIERLSTDHTLIQSMMDAGTLKDEEEDGGLPYGHLVYKSLGGGTLELDPVKKYILKSGDQLFICSDGISKYLSDSEILEIAIKNLDSNNSVDDYIAVANERGGEDNITAVYLKTGGAKQPPPDLPEVLLETEPYLFKIVIKRSTAHFATAFMLIFLILSLIGVLAGS